ncbi:MAG: hypothetical protein J0J01_13535 [Reyranella sp.]|uniref:hypothetical protein n=1 Tax=Reyranella sp. TaxID=1929291 RepID=UPI001ACBD5F9|nr:hypothetical protein [Reyranella sp.]MBN9087928.1 hypothetical protein [Reyranella sp.]
MPKSSVRSMIALAGVATFSLLATAANAADLTREDEIAIRGDIVTADSKTRMIVLESPERDTLGYRVLPTMGASSAGDTFPRLRPGVTVDMRYYRIVDVLVAKSSPEVDQKAQAMLTDPAQAPGILDTGTKVKLWKVQGMVVRTDLAAKKMDVVDPQGGMIYRTPWIKSKEGQAALAALKPGDMVTCIFTERTAFEVVPIN